MVTLVSVPLATFTAAELLMDALFEPSLGVIVIWASEDFLAAAASAWACELSPLPLPEALSSPPEQAESTSTPPSSADAAIRPLRRLLSVITRFSIVAESAKHPESPSITFNATEGSSRSTCFGCVVHTTSSGTRGAGAGPCALRDDETPGGGCRPGSRVPRGAQPMLSSSS